jgi:hypothetical protein
MTTQGINDQYERLARSVSARLSESTANLPHEVTERLRASRYQALAKRKLEASPAVPAVGQNSILIGGLGEAATLQTGRGDSSLWGWVSSTLALLTLVAGLMTIASIQDDIRAHELADIDAELLTDVLPPSAYTDPGFAQFLRSAPGH